MSTIENSIESNCFAHNGKNLEDKAMLTLDKLSQYTGFSKGTIYQRNHFKKTPYSKPLGGNIFIFLRSMRLSTSKSS